MTKLILLTTSKHLHSHAFIKKLRIVLKSLTKKMAVGKKAEDKTADGKSG